MFPCRELWPGSWFLRYPLTPGPRERCLSRNTWSSSCSLGNPGLQRKLKPLWMGLTLQKLQDDSRADKRHWKRAREGYCLGLAWHCRFPDGGQIGGKRVALGCLGLEGNFGMARGWRRSASGHLHIKTDGLSREPLKSLRRVAKRRRISFNHLSGSPETPAINICLA